MMSEALPRENNNFVNQGETTTDTLLKTPCYFLGIDLPAEWANKFMVNSMRERQNITITGQNDKVANDAEVE
jgi:hypothetical protein